MLSWLRTSFGSPPPPRDPDKVILSDVPDFVKAKPRPRTKGPTWKERLEEEDRRERAARGSEPAEDTEVIEQATKTTKTSGVPTGTVAKKRKAVHQPEQEVVVSVDEKSGARKGVSRSCFGKHKQPRLGGVFDPGAPLNKRKTTSLGPRKKYVNLGLKYAKIPPKKLVADKQQPDKKDSRTGDLDGKQSGQKIADKKGMKRKKSPSREIHAIPEEEGGRPSLSPRSQELLNKLKKRRAGEISDDSETEPPPQKKSKNAETSDDDLRTAKDWWNDCVWNPEKLFGEEYKRRPGVPLNTALLKGSEHLIPKLDLRYEDQYFESMKPPKPKIDWEWCSEEEASPPRPPPAPFVPPPTQAQPTDTVQAIPAIPSTSDKPAAASSKNAEEKTDPKTTSAATTTVSVAPSSSFVFGNADTSNAAVPMFGNIGSTPVSSQPQPTIGNMFSPAVQRPDRKRVIARRNRSQDANQGIAPAPTGNFGAISGPTAQPSANPSANLFAFGTQPAGGGAAAAAAQPQAANPFGNQQVVFSVPGAPSGPSFGQPSPGAANSAFSGNAAPTPQFGGFGMQSQATSSFNTLASPGFGPGNAQQSPSFGQAPSFAAGVGVGGGGMPGGGATGGMGAPAGGGGFTLGAMDGQKPRHRRRVRRTSPHR